MAMATTTMRVEVPVKRLMLMRHAKSSWKYPVSDHRRPLNSRGKKSSRAVGQYLHEAKIWPSLVLSSDAKRTKETWANMARAVGSEVASSTRVLYLPEFYGIFDRPATDVIMESVWRHAGGGEGETAGSRSEREEDEGAEARGGAGAVSNDVLVLGHNDGWELALNEFVGSYSGVHSMKTADLYVLEPQDGETLQSWEDIFESFGKWRIRHHVVARDLL